MSKTSLSAFIDLNREANWHPIYASQLYGTFFMIYAQFKTNLIENNYYLQDVKLHLVNFKGVLDLGITRAEFVPKHKIDKIEVPTSIKIEVQALYISKENDLSVKNIDKKYPLAKGNSVLLIDRRVLPMRPNGRNIIEKALKDGIFDTEFYYREGPLSRENPPIALEIIPADWNDKGDTGIIGIGTPKCPKSLLHVV